MNHQPASLRELQNELSHIYQRIDFRDEKYKDHCEEWKSSEAGVVYLETTLKLKLISLELEVKIKKINPELLNPIL